MNANHNRPYQHHSSYLNSSHTHLHPLSKKNIADREKSSPFECGFDPKGSARMPFSLRFFLIAIIFLIFNVEITLLLPLTTIITFTNVKTWTVTGLFFLLVLLLGLYHEWAQGALEWSE